MPRKPTGGERGRPAKDRESGQLWRFKEPTDPKSFELTAPGWWIAMAEREAAWRAAGEWKERGSSVRLAEEFAVDGKLASDLKSASAISKARRDPRYRAEVARHMHEMKRLADRPTKTSKSSEDLRSSLEAAFEEAAVNKGDFRET